MRSFKKFPKIFETFSTWVSWTLRVDKPENTIIVEYRRHSFRMQRGIACIDHRLGVSSSPLSQQDNELFPFCTATYVITLDVGYVMLGNARPVTFRDLIKEATKTTRKLERSILGSLSLSLSLSLSEPSTVSLAYGFSLRHLSSILHFL